MTTDKAKGTNQLLRVLAVLGWTGLCGVGWLLWIGGMTTIPLAGEGLSTRGSETALGCASCMVTGCVGGVWFFGLVVFLVVLLIVRR